MAVTARRRDRIDQLVEKIRSNGGSAIAQVLDVTDEESIARTVQDIGEECGRIDVLINNAGFIANGPALRAELSDWRRTVDVNIDGVLGVTHAALPYVLEAAQGRRSVANVVMVSSIAGRKVPARSSNVYSATKHAVGAFSEALRQELTEHRVRVGIIEPGVVRTEMTTGGSKDAPDATSGTPLQPSDVADSLIFMITQPPHAAVNEILIRPTEQAI